MRETSWVKGAAFADFTWRAPDRHNMAAQPPSASVIDPELASALLHIGKHFDPRARGAGGAC
jgi:hypothetical protein